MAGNIVTAILITGLFVFFFVVVYYNVFCGLFGVVFKRNRGKRTGRKAREKYTGFWKKFLFLDYRNSVAGWYYIAYIVFVVSFVLLVVIVNMEIFNVNSGIFASGSMPIKIVAFSFLVTSCFPAFVHRAKRR